MKLVDFGVAIKALKEGKRVQRKGWNGKGLFIFMQVPAIIKGKTVPLMQSLPDSVKRELSIRNGHCLTEDHMLSLKFKNQIAMMYPDNTVYGWVASPSDILEEDWVILD